MSATLLDAGWPLAFVGGLLSFLSPCVAPLVPGYLSFLAGGAGVGQHGSRSEAERVLTVSLLFVLGFSTVFVVLGAGVAVFGAALDNLRPFLNRLAGLVMIVMGIAVSGLVRIPFLLEERRLQLIDLPFGPLGSVLVGMTFALGWTPCIGPILASILLYAGATETVERGALLLLIYSLGLGLPFVLVGLGWSRALAIVDLTRRYGGVLNLVSATILVSLGVLFLTNQAFYLNIFAQRLFYDLQR